MNTPLNDALKPCPFCGKQPEMANVLNFPPDDYQWYVQCCCDVAPASWDKDQNQAIAAWNTRANTPESSAAQGAMGDDAARYQYLKATTTAIRNAETGESESCTPEQFESAIDAARGAQPSDATAQPINSDDMNDAVLPGLASLNEQAAGDLLAEMDDVAPRVDLTDERAAFEAWWASEENRCIPARYEDGGYKNQYAHAAWNVWQARALLANTAQGKPEHQECSGDPSSCPENEGFGCCGEKG